MFSRSTFRGLIAINLCCAAVTAPVMVYSVVYVDTELDLGAGALAPLLAACGVGSLCTAILLPMAGRYITPRSTALAGAVIGCGALLATTTAHLAGLTYPALLAVWFVIGIATSLMNTSAPRLIADHTDAGSAADVFTAQFSASHAAFLITYPLAGVTATHGAAGPGDLHGPRRRLEARRQGSRGRGQQQGRALVAEGLHRGVGRLSTGAGSDAAGLGG